MGALTTNSYVCRKAQRSANVNYHASLCDRQKTNKPFTLSKDDLLKDCSMPKVFLTSIDVLVLIKSVTGETATRWLLAFRSDKRLPASARD